MHEVEMFVPKPSTEAAVWKMTFQMDHLAWKVAAIHKGTYNGYVSVENGKIRATVEFTERKNALAVLKVLRVYADLYRGFAIEPRYENIKETTISAQVRHVK